MRSICAMVVMAGIAPQVWSEEKTIENPVIASWAKQKAGTTLTQLITIEGPSIKSETTLTYTVVEVKADKVVLELATKTKIGGMVFTPPASNIEIVKSVKADETKKPEGETTEGEETLKISGKEYKTKWTKLKSKNGDSENQVWTSSGVPNLIVKSITKTTGKGANGTTTVEVTEIKVP